MNSLWLSVFLLAVSWLFIVPLYERPQSAVWVLLMLSGVACAVYALRKTCFRGSSKGLVVIVPAAVLASLLLSFPFNAGPVLLGIGAVAMIAAPRTRSLGAGVAFAGLVVSIQALAVPVYMTLVPSFGDAGPVGRLAQVILGVFGAPVASYEDGLVLSTGAGTIIYSLDWAALGAFTLTLFVVGAIRFSS